MDFLVALRRHVHRQNFTRPHGTPISRRRAAGADAGHAGVDERFRRHRAGAGAESHRRTGVGFMVSLTNSV